MKKRFVVIAVVALALAATAVPAFGQGTSAHAPRRGSVAAISMKGVLKSLNSSPQANWTNLASMNTATAEQGGGAFLANRMWVPGGYDTAGNVFGQMQIYNANTNTWSTDPDLLSTLTGLPGVVDAAVCADTATKTIHVINGSLDGTSIYTSHLVFSPLNPAGSKWSFLAPPNTVADGNFYSQDSGCTFIGGKLYLFGGYGLTDTQGVAQMERITWAYDPSTDTWSDTGRLMVTGRIWQAYAATSSRAFVAGGVIDIDTLAETAATETFTTSGGWKPMASLPAARAGAGMGLIGSTINVFAGFDSAFVPLSSTVGCVAGGCVSGPWVDQVKTLNTARGFAAWAAGGNKLFVAGGFNGAFAALSSAERTT
jgi:hypothetical protein